MPLALRPDPWQRLVLALVVELRPRSSFRSRVGIQSLQQKMFQRPYTPPFWLFGGQYHEILFGGVHLGIGDAHQAPARKLLGSRHGIGDRKACAKRGQIKCHQRMWHGQPRISRGHKPPTSGQTTDDV